MGVDKFRKYSENLFEEDLDVSSIIDKEGEFDLVKLVKKSIDPVTGIPRNMKLPEGDFKEAKNYFDYVSNFLGHEAKFPFARQLWLLTMLLGEYCPRCSDKKFLKIENVPVDYDPRHTPDRLQYLNYGRCPKCKATKSELVSAKEMNLYIEMALCVSGYSRVQTAFGYLQIKDIPNTGKIQSGLGFKKYRNWTNNGIQKVTRVVTRTGHFTETTSEHKHLVFKDNGFCWVKQKDLKVGTPLVHQGKFKNPVTTYYPLNLPDINTNFSRTGEAKKPLFLTEDLAYLIGLWEADGHYRVGDAVLSNTSRTILKKAEVCIKTIFDLDVGYSLKVSNHAGSIVRDGYTRNKDCYHLALRNTQASTWLQLIGSGKKSKYNNVPEGIWSSPDSVVLAYLAGSLDGDGGQRSSSSNRGTALTTTSVENAEGLHLLLTRLGIISFLRPGVGVFIAGQYSDLLINMLRPYLVKPFKTKPNSKIQQSGEFGLPAGAIWELIDNNIHAVSRKEGTYSFKDGTTFTTKDWEGFRSLTSLNSRTKFLCPLKAKKGYYDSLLDLVESLSPKLGKALKIMNKKNLFCSLAVKKIEKSSEEVFDIEVKKHHSFVCNGVVVHNCIGQRAGKSTLTSSVVSYIIHKYLKFPKLSSVCDGIAGSTPLTGTFVGGRTSDAIALLWEPITNIISESPWFQNFHSMLQDRGEHYGIEFYRSKDLYLRYAHRNLEFYPSGPTKRGLRGRTRIITATDEIGWFPTAEESGKDRERADAPEVYDALDRSLLTVRREVRSLLGKGYDNFIPGLAINISSPSSQTDMISRLVNENKDSKRVLAVRLATWEVNPLYRRDNEEIEEAFRKNPVNAERDYGANPPLNASKFIDVAEDQIHRCFTLNNSAAIEQKSKVIKDRLRIAGVLSNVSKPSVIRNSLMAIDAGFTNNAFSVVIITAEEQPLAGGTKTVILKTPVMLEIVPKDGGSLHFSKIYDEILYKLIEIFNVKYLFADRWNSIALLDRAEEDFQKIDFKSTSYSVKYDDFIITKSYLQEQKLLLPKLEMSQEEILRVDNYPYGFLGKPAAHLMYQLMTVKDRGKTVIKGTNATDDIFRALVLGVSRALNDKILPELLKSVVPLESRRLVGAVVTTRLGGSSYIASSPKSTYLSGNSTPETNSTKSKNIVLVSRR